MNKNEMPVVEKPDFYSVILDGFIEVLHLHGIKEVEIPNTLTLSVSNTLQSYTEKVTEKSRDLKEQIGFLHGDIININEKLKQVTEENKRLNLLLVAQSKDIVTARKVTEERDSMDCCGTCIRLHDSLNGWICSEDNKQKLRNQVCDEYSSIFKVCDRESLNSLKEKY